MTFIHVLHLELGIVVSLIMVTQFLTRTIPYTHMHTHLRFLYIPTPAVLFQATFLFVALYFCTAAYRYSVSLFSQVTQVLID